MRAKFVNEAFEKGKSARRVMKAGTVSRVKEIVQGHDSLKWIDTENRNALVQVDTIEALNDLFEELGISLPERREFWSFQRALEEIYYSTFVVIDGQKFAKDPQNSYVLIQIEYGENEEDQKWTGINSQGKEMTYQELEEWHAKVDEEE